MNVKAVDATGKEQKITITASSGLSEQEIEKMTKDAEAHAEEDKKKRESIEIRNAAETLVYSSEKALKDAGDKVKQETGKEVTEKIEAVKEALKGDNTDKIKEAADKLSETIKSRPRAIWSTAATKSEEQKKYQRR